MSDIRAQAANWRLTVQYDGRGYHGWQKQPNHISIQEELEKAFAMLLREPITLTGSGRTDAGVHALGQVANFRTSVPVEPARLRWQLNSILPEEIVVSDIEKTADSWHARFSATARTYSYLILNQPHPSPFWRHQSWWIAKDLDLEAMREGAEYLEGTHDFAGFTVAKDGPTVREVRTVAITVEPGAGTGASDRESSRVSPGGLLAPGLIRVRITANAFLYHMVRLIVGTLAEVGTGKREAKSVREILDKKDVRACGPRAPAKGLVLERVHYD